MSDDALQDPLEEIEQTVWKVLRLAYLRPILRDSKVQAYQMSEEEIGELLEPFSSKLASDMDILSECLRASRMLGASDLNEEPVNDDIVLKGNDHD